MEYSRPGCSRVESWRLRSESARVIKWRGVNVQRESVEVFHYDYMSSLVNGTRYWEAMLVKDLMWLISQNDTTQSKNTYVPS